MSEPKPPMYTADIDQVVAAEMDRIDPKKQNKKLVGLALSGGGIRSASFSMGLLQAMARDKESVLSKVDYLSTVSGGGYTGSSLTWFLNKGLPDGRPAGTNETNFPFGEKNQGGKISTDKNLILDFIRQHGNYLTPGKGLDFVSLVAVVIRSTFVSLLVYFSLLTVVMSILKYTGLFTNSIKLFSFESAPFLFKSVVDFDYPFPFDKNIILNSAIGLVMLIAIFSVLYSMSTMRKAPYSWLIAAQKYAGTAWAWVVTLFCIGLIPIIIEYICAEISASAGGITGILIGLYEQFRSRKPNDENSSLSTIRVLIGAIALLYSMLVFSYMSAHFLLEYGVLWVVGLLVVALVVGFWVNLNIFGLNRMYRDRLMETFMANMDSIKRNIWAPATEANTEKLKNMCEKDKNPRPYHIINTNLVTTDSDKAELNGRGGDNFILSPIYCGSDATGWETTDTYRDNRVGNYGITLATAMAISAAAVNPYAGPDGQGLTKNKLISVLLGLLNIQLGFWSDNPKKKSIMGFPTNFITPGLSGNVLGRNLDENNRSLLLTDGGHFENLAIYELIRRRLKVIVASDAGCDPDYKFEDLTNLMEKVRVDFGTTIIFRESHPLEDIIPNAENRIFDEKIAVAKQGFAVADIYYSEDSNSTVKKGVLIYIKTTLTKDLPVDLYGYKMANPSFPDETTADQFFSEVQFEAYRELGYQLGKNVDWSLMG